MGVGLASLPNSSSIISTGISQSLVQGQIVSFQILHAGDFAGVFFLSCLSLRICRMGPFISKASGRKIASRNNCLHQRLLWAALSWDFSWLLQQLASFLAISPPPHSLNIVGHCESCSAPLDFLLWGFFLSSRKANLAFHLFLRFKDCL